MHVQCVVPPVAGLAAGAACCLGMDWEEMGLSVTQVPHLPLFLCMHAFEEVNRNPRTTAAVIYL